MDKHTDDILRLQKAYDVIVDLEHKLQKEKEKKPEPIAVVGIGCKFPGNVESPKDFFELLSTGKNTIGDIPEKRWNFEDYAQENKEKIYCKKGAFLDHVYDFDPLFFNISPLEAEFMDPQHRIFLEICYRALEDAGYTQKNMKEASCAVYAGLVSNDYYGYLDHTPHKVEAYEVIGNYNSMLSARISYFLNLRGPAITVDTACSSSAVAIHLACNAIKSGDCNIALAGGVTLYLTPRPYLLMCESTMLSKTGQTYAFDQRADGFVPGEGCGVVVLKSLSEAIKDKDHIYGLIQDTAANQDGRSNGITAPSVLAQTKLETYMLQKNNLKPEDISYIEAHGTGTKLGDPIEIDGLNQTFSKLTNAKQFCAIGSLKPNVGHLEGAAGVASLIKLMLCLEHKKLVPTINYMNENEHIHFKDTAFYVQDQLTDWSVPKDTTRKAMMNAFGFSGTNVNILVEEYQPKENTENLKQKNLPNVFLIPLSATNDAVLTRYANELKTFLSKRCANSNTKGKTNPAIGTWVQETLAQLYSFDEKEIDLSMDFEMYATDTVAMLKFIDAIQEEYHLSLDFTYMNAFHSLQELCEYISRHGQFETNKSQLSNSNNLANEDVEFLYQLSATLQLRRTALSHRTLFVVEDMAQLIAQLSNFIKRKAVKAQTVKLTANEDTCKNDWFAGHEADWMILYPNGIPQNISAPVYPFDQKEYLIQPIEKKETVIEIKKENNWNYRYFIPARTTETAHIVKGRQLLPATYMIVLFCDAMEQSCHEHLNQWNTKAYTFDTVSFRQPIDFMEPDKKELLVSVSAQNERIHLSLQGNHQYQVYASATVTQSDSSVNQLVTYDSFPCGHLMKTIDKDAWYQMVTDSNFQYGKSYQLVENIKIYEESVIATLSNCAFHEGNLSGDRNPYIIDAAIQPVVALLRIITAGFDMAVPQSITSLQIFDSLTKVKKSKIQYLGLKEENRYAFQILLTGDHDHVIAAFDEVIIQVLGAKSLESLRNESNQVEVNETQILKQANDYLIKEIAEISKTNPNDIEIKQPFQVYGMDSFLSLKLIENMEKKFGRLPKTILFEYFTVEKLAQYLIQKFPKAWEQEASNQTSNIKPTVLEIKPMKRMSLHKMPTNESSVVQRISSVVKSSRAVASQIVATTTISSKGNAIFLSEDELNQNPKLKGVIDSLRGRFEMEGLAYARGEIAPDVFLGARQLGFFYVAKKESSVLAFLYVGEESYFDELAEEFEQYFTGNHIYYLLPKQMKAIGGKEVLSLSIGAFQRMEALPESLSGNKYRHLRYAIRNFTKDNATCVTKEYHINTEESIDRQIIGLIDAWCASKKMVNQYIQVVREQILTKRFPNGYRFFLTYRNDSLENVIVITPIPASNGYLMDLEFYGETMEFGGLEYAIVEIYRMLSKEGVTMFSLGATFGINADVEGSNDTDWMQSFHELQSQKIFDGSGNYQFKNKFRTNNTPIYLNRLSNDHDGNLIDVILFIADPVGVTRKTEKQPDYSLLESHYASTLYLSGDTIDFDLLTDSWSELSKFANTANVDVSLVSDLEMMATLQTYFPYDYIVPVSSGRYAESLFFSSLPKDKKVVVQNVLFPTTRCNLLANGFTIYEMPTLKESDSGKKGDINLSLLKEKFETGEVGYAVFELSDNALGGVATSFENLKEVSNLCHQYKVSLIFDATRAIENACCIAHESAAYEEILNILRETLSLSDGMIASLTKEYGTNIGGIVATKDANVFATVNEKMVLQGSGINYTSKMEIYHSMKDSNRIISNVIARLKAVEQIGDALSNYIPVIQNKMSHCVLIDVRQIPNLKGYSYKAQVYANWFYLVTGIRIGVHSTSYANMGEEDNYLRLTVPVGYTAQEISEIIERIDRLKTAKQIFKPITLYKAGPKEFGSIKNKYQFTKESTLTLKNTANSNNQGPVSHDIESTDIAVIGISGRYPEAENVFELWDNLVAGRDCVTEIPSDRWDLNNYYDKDKKKPGKNPCKWGGFMKDVDKFDARFFKISPYEAEKMDPQQRLFLQEAWHVIEDAGYSISDLREKTEHDIGVFVGATWAEYSTFTNLEADFYPEINLGSIATRCAYYLDFCGPVMTVDTHCSSSLTALYLAYESLIHEKCKVAIAGGVNLSLAPNKYQFARHFLSETGKCQSFGAGADGYVPSEGVGAVLLKPLKEALNDNDHIYGVIKGIGLRHGGKTGGVTVPNAHQQARVIKEAYENAGINPSTIHYIEAHGTGTPLGDPIEINGLTEAFGNVNKTGFCSIGSIKSNLGHGEAATGISQVIKVMLQLKYKKLVPSLFSEPLNPEIDFSHSPFYVQKDYADWNLCDSNCNKRRAGISSFGAGGVNCHVVVEEASANPADYKQNNESYYIVPLSANRKEALKEMAENLMTFLSTYDKEDRMEEIAYTLQMGREVLQSRIVFIGKNKDDIIYLCKQYCINKQNPNIITEETVSSLQESNCSLEWRELVKDYITLGIRDWNRLYPNGTPKKVSLPGYPFAKESYWAPKKRNNDQKPLQPQTTNPTKTLKNCYLYQKTSRQASITKNIVSYQKILLFDENEEFANKLREYGETVILVSKGAEYKKLPSNTYTINYKEKNDFARFFEEVGVDANTLLLYQWFGNEIQLDTYYDSFIEPSLHFFAALNKYAFEDTVHVLCCAVKENTESSLYLDAYTSFLKTISLENTNIKIKYVTFDTKKNSDFLAINELREEFSDFLSYTYLHGERNECAYKEIVSTGNLDEQIKEHGTYLITGGGKGIGYKIALAIASRKHVNFVLAGRSKENETILEHIHELSALGSKVTYITTDITKKSEINSLIQHTKDTYGSIHGIFHSAGVLKDSYALRKTKEEFTSVAAPKIAGLRALDEATKNEPLDFFVVFSSLAAVMGNIGQCDYSFANHYMDVYMVYRTVLSRLNKRSGKSISINWPLWEEGGMQIPEIKKKLLFDQFGLTTLPTKDGVQALFDALSCDTDEVVVTIGDQRKLEERVLCGKVVKDAQQAWDCNKVLSPSITIEPSATESIVNEDIKNLPTKEESLVAIYEILKQLVSEETKLPVEKIDVLDPMEDYGLDSIMVESILDGLETYFGKLSPTVLFEYQTIDELARYLIKKQVKPLVKEEKQSEQTDSINDIAIIGFNGRYPGCDSIEEFWQGLKDGKDFVTEVPLNRWDAKKEEEQGVYCKWGGFLNHIDEFDAMLFNISPKEAETIDPQERIFLEDVWTLMEKSGYTREELAKRYPKGKGGDIGVFVGETTNSYQLLIKEETGKDTVYPISSPWSIANRISFVFNFTGPSMTVDTACSSSLVAIHLACESLKRKECRMAVAGGVNLYLHKSKYASMCQLGMLSKTGKCHTFGKEADGFVPGEGVGSILLKPLKEAIADGDSIYGVIKGTAINHGGKTNGYKVPSANSQAGVVKEALSMAHLCIEDLSYIEAHGTGTSLGDPIEIDGLSQLYVSDKKNICPIGSVKTNIGHGEAVAGMAGITKVLLQMQHKTIVPSLHSAQLNPYIDFANSPFYVPQKIEEWNENEEPLRAGISAFGAGGVNAHVILESFSQNPTKSLDSGNKTDAKNQSDKKQLFIFSAKDKIALKNLVDEMLEDFLKHSYSLIELAYTLMIAREEFEERLAIVAFDRKDFIYKLRKFLNQEEQEDIYTGNKNDATKTFLPQENLQLQQLLLEKNEKEIALNWIQGARFDWTQLFPCKQKRLLLPTYPFAKKSYWVEKKEVQPLLYLKELWRQESALNSKKDLAQTKIMLIGTREQLALKPMFESILSKPVEYTVTLGSCNTKVNEQEYELDTVNGYLDVSILANAKPEEIYFLGGLQNVGDDTPDAYDTLNRTTALPLIQLLKQYRKNIKFKVFTNRSVSINATDSLENVYCAALLGLCKTAPQEYRTLSIDCIDFSGSVITDSSTTIAAAGCSISREELQMAINESYTNECQFIAYRSGNRYTRTLTKEEISTSKEPFFHINGRYLVLGGFGGIGFVTSKLLAKHYGASLIFVGRSALDEKKQAAIKEITSLGGNVTYLQGDIANTSELVEKLKNMIGNNVIDGVIHAVANVENSLLQTMSEAVYNKTVGTQVNALKLLELLYQEFHITNMLIYSSASSYFGNQGGANYSASNSLKDAFAKMLVQKYHINAKVINWGLWQGIGLGREFSDVLGKKFMSVIPISPKVGFDAIDDIAHSRQNFVIALTASKELLTKETDLYKTSREASEVSENVQNNVEKSKEMNATINNSSMMTVTATETTNKEMPVNDQELTAFLKKIAAVNLKMEPDDIHVNVPLGDYGMDSIIGVNIVEDLQDTFGELPATFIYDYYTIHSIKNYIKENNLTAKLSSKVEKVTMTPQAQTQSQTQLQNQTQPQAEAVNEIDNSRDIAIIGVAGIYPEADNLEEFWSNLVQNKNCITKITKDRYDGDHYEKTGAIYSNFGGFIRNIMEFDPLFFKISPKEAKGIDPQERLFLQTAYHTFNDAGYTKALLSNEKVGVFVGVTNNTYQMQGVENFVKGVKEDIPFAQAYSIANRVSYVFNLKGPSMAIDTACSSSLSAVHMACESLLANDCKVALVGGVNLYTHPYKYASLCQMSMLSKRGKCSAFQESADGFVPGEGIGAILLKPLKQAIKDGDCIQAVIKATAMNHGGRTNGYTVPNKQAQSELVLEALKKANINPRTISYVEAHGTGTALGDPIEIAGLTKAYEKYTNDRNYCSIGSIKTNIGHLESASGIASITKVLLQMKYQTIAGSYMTDAINSKINLSETPFYLQRETTPWQPNYKENLTSGKGILRRAGISSFGAGGANVHVIMEEYCGTGDEKDKMTKENLIILSAESKEQVHKMASNLLEKLNQNEASLSLSNIAYTLQTGRDEYKERLAILATSVENLKNSLTAYLAGETLENIYVGRATVDDGEEIHALKNDSILNLKEVANQWVNGTCFDWNFLYQGENVHKVSLPGYVFSTRPLTIAYKMENYDTCNRNFAAAKSSTQEILSLNASISDRFPLDINESFIKDHQVQGKYIVAGATYLNCVLEVLSANHENNSQLALSNIKFLTPLEINESGMSLQVLRTEDKGITRFQVAACKQSLKDSALKNVSQPDLNLECQVGTSEELMPVSKNQIMQLLETGTVFQKQEIYQTYQTLGMDYGTTFQGIQKFYVKDRKAVAILSNEAIETFSNEFIIYPGLLDSALQSILAFFMGQNAKAMLPYYIKSFQLCKKSCRFHYVYLQKPDSKMPQFNLTVLDDTYEIVLQIKEFFVRPIESTSTNETNESIKEHTNATRNSSSKPKDAFDTLCQSLTDLVCEILELKQDEVDPDTELGDYGFDSLSFTTLCDRLNETYMLNLSPAVVFEYPTISNLSQCLIDKYHVTPEVVTEIEPEPELVPEFESELETVSESVPMQKTNIEIKETAEDDIAIIGIAGLMPHSKNLEDFFEQLMEGVDFITEVPQSRWDWKKYYGDPIHETNKTKAKWGGFIDDVDKFDADFFHISNREASLMDPQQRILLELAWNVVEDAGYSMQQLNNSKTGVVIGVASNCEYNNLLNEHMKETQVYQSTGVAASVLTNRISYMFNWHGLSEPVDTACSSSLVAIHRAVMAIKNGECEQAVAGGTNLILTPNGAVSFGKAGMLSPDGRCKTFSKDANGYVRSEGMGLVFLKPLSKAMKDGDDIYAVIRGCAVNHGGKGNSITSPNPNAQAEVIKDAMKMAHVNFHDIDIIETHGTGTKIGDVIEVNGLKKAYKDMNPQSNHNHKIALTGVKANVGHMETAAGMSSLFKMIYTLKTHQLPPQIHISEMNPEIDFEDTPFYVNEMACNLPKHPLTVGISSFGFGGVNAHMIISEYTAPKYIAPAKNSYLITLSAKDMEGLIQRAVMLRNAISKYTNAAATGENLSKVNQSQVNLSPNENHIKYSIRQTLILMISDTLGMQKDEIQTDMLLSDMGFDTVLLGNLCDAIEKEYQVTLTLHSMLALETIDGIISYLMEQEQPNLQKEIQMEQNIRIEIPMEARKEEQTILSRLSYTLLTGRNEMEVRGAFIVHNMMELQKQLDSFCQEKTTTYFGTKMKKGLQKPTISQEDILDCFANEEYQKIAQHYIAGEDLDFAGLFNKTYIPKLHLPVYPFHKNSYWFEDFAKQEICQFTVEDSALSGFTYQVNLDPVYDLICQHVIDDKILLPGAFSLELLHKIGKKFYGENTNISITNLCWFAPCEIKANRGQMLYIYVEESCICKVKVVSFFHNKKTIHINAELHKYTETSFFVKSPLSDETSDSGKEIDVASLYHMYQMKGFHYGSSFQTLTKLMVKSEEVIATLKRNDTFTYTDALHPAMIDGAFQAVAGINLDCEKGMAYLPFSVKNIIIYGEIKDSCKVYVKRLEEQNNARKYSILLMDCDGKALVYFDEFTIKAFKKNQEYGNLCFAPQYFETSTLLHQSSIKHISYVSLLDPPDFGQNINWQETQEFLHSIDHNMKNNYEMQVVVALSKHHDFFENEVFLACFRFIKSLLRTIYGTKITFVFVLKEDESIEIKALAAFLRTVCLENQNYKIKFVTFDSYNRQLIEDECNESFQGFHEICYHEGTRLERNLALIKDLKGDVASAFKKESTYLIVGGNGGIGYILADYLLMTYDATIVILSRSNTHDKRFDSLTNNLRNRVTFYQGDITDYDSTQSVLQRILRDHPGINGIFQLAGVLNDSLILSKNEGKLKTVLNPKIKGIRNLDLLTKDWNLDFLCTFSSVTAVNGNKGQSDYAYANAYMDLYMKQRAVMVAQNERHGKSITINWPFWETGGMVLTKEILDRQYEEYGILPMKDTAGMKLLEHAMNSNYVQVAALYGNEDKLKETIRPMGLCEQTNMMNQNTVSNTGQKLQKINVVNQETSKKQLKEDLTSIFAGILKIDASTIDSSQDLEMYGFDSLMMMEALEKIEQLVDDSSLSPSVINDYKTIDNITGYILEETDFLKRKQDVFQVPQATKEDETVVEASGPIETISNENEDEDDRIAVIGIACRFPDANNPEEYFMNLKNEKDLIREVPKNRFDIDKYYSKDLEGKNTTASRWGSFLNDIDHFDASYFGLSDLDAQIMDPQQRLILELSEELIRDAGYDASELSGKNVGVYLGASESTYLKDRMEYVPKEGMKHVVVGTIQNMIAARVSDYYDLKGPSLVMDTACSSSLVAIDEACHHIKTGECSMAIAGGVQLLLDPVIHIGLSQAGVLTKEPIAYVFDERSKGIVIGEGAGVVLLKKLRDAKRDGDRIYAVVLGSAINNDGHTMGITTPSQESQKEVIEQAIKNSKISPDTISYYEAHGTGTLLGDPIEIKAATQVYREYTEKESYCAVGSVKANMGHLLRAAGIASFIKVLMSMQHKEIVKTIHCEIPHKRFHFEASPFYPNMKTRPWNAIDGHRRAAISSFGFGGTNCHMILEDYNPEENSYTKVTRSKKPLPVFQKKVYWLGKEIDEKIDSKEELRKLLIQLKAGEITPEEAIARSKNIQ